MRSLSWTALCVTAACHTAQVPVAATPQAHGSVCAHASAALPVPPTPAAKLLLHAGRIFDAALGSSRNDVDILIEGDRIVAVGSSLTVREEHRELDLRQATVLPGLIDVHTHVLHPGADYLRGLVSQSVPARVLRASAAAQSALLHGFTSLRDVESEGAMFADVDLQRAINEGVVAGPRMWVSTRGLSTPGRYEPLASNWELDLPTGAQLVVGADAARAAVRDQVAHGADWIKVYADYFPLTLDEHGVIHGALNFRNDELSAIVDEAHRLGRKIAAHAISHEGIAQAVTFGVDSLEHAHGLSADLVPAVLRKGIFVVPTLLAEDAMLPLMEPPMRALFEQGYRNLQHAFRAGVQMAYGTDLGSVPWSTNGSTGLRLYVERLGMTPSQALRTATVQAAELLGQRRVLGEITEGALADLIAVSGNPLDDIRQLDQVMLVVKGGQIMVGNMPTSTK